jgi:hypothetical protein
MFTWICPQCGKEVPPSYSECPACAERRQQAAQPPQPQYPPQPAAPPQSAYPPPQAARYAPPQPQYQPPPQPQYQPPQQPQYQPPPQAAPSAPPAPPQYAPPQQPGYQQPPAYYQPPQSQAPVYTIDNGGKKGMPTWLVALLTLVVIGGGLFGVYRILSTRNGKTNAADSAATQAPGVITSSNPYAKYIEVVGVRLLESADKKPLVRFAVINHSPAELSGLELRINFTASTGGSGSQPIAVVDAKVGSVPAYGIKDMESPLSTNLKIYELPDWQFVRTSVEITAPK